MNPTILDYLKTQKVCVIAVEMPDGSPHAATVHFAFNETTEQFVIMTSPESRKYEALVKGKARASIVIGTSEGCMQTFQLDGEATLSIDPELQKLYFEKFPKAAHLFKKDTLFTFTPKWWRFTDWTKKGDKTIITS